MSILRKCAVRGCGCKFSRSHKSPHCPKHRTRLFREKHPLKYYYNKLRQCSRGRGKPFTLTFSQYEAFCVNTDYHRLKGKSSLSLSIDRIDNALGYHWWNIRAVTIAENCRKEYVHWFSQQGLTKSEREKQDFCDLQFGQQLEAAATLLIEAGIPAGDRFFWAILRSIKQTLYTHE